MNVQQAAIQSVRCGAKRAQHGLHIGAALLRAPQQDVIMGPACTRPLFAALPLTLVRAEKGLNLHLSIVLLRASQQGALMLPACAGRLVLDSAQTACFVTVAAAR